tara:strand:- start:3537 stop:3845 length:309 start_codon:yes stop_codon:yes gene_type:complete
MRLAMATPATKIAVSAISFVARTKIVQGDFVAISTIFAYHLQTVVRHQIVEDMLATRQRVSASSPVRMTKIVKAEKSATQEEVAFPFQNAQATRLATDMLAI